MDADLIFPF